MCIGNIPERSQLRAGCLGRFRNFGVRVSSGRDKWRGLRKCSLRRLVYDSAMKLDLVLAQGNHEASV